MADRRVDKRADKSPDRKLTQVASPSSAIASYLDELLHTATDSAVEEFADEPVAAEPEPAPEPEPRPAPEPENTRKIGQALQRAAAAEHNETPLPPEQESPGRPEWSHKPFECLIFTVAGLKLAVPLILLGAIHRIDRPVKPIPGSPRWYMGMRPDSVQNLRVVDSAEWIMAGRAPADARDHYRFIIRLDRSEWGLACDDVAQSFTLKPDDVRWRTARSKRPWLAGTVIEHMCALIDVRSMADLLVRAEREHHLDLS